MALTQDMHIEARSTERLIPLAVAADAVIFLGATVAVNAAGFAVPAEDKAGLKVVGIAQKFVSNAGGADGAVIVEVQKGVFGLKNSQTNPVTQAQVGRDVFVEDDGTVASTGANTVIVGVVDEISPGGRVFVHFA